jgi:beta-phosphoglucomutase-like phosphatase (HAD superfamily)
MLRRYLEDHDSFGVVARGDELDEFIDKWSLREQRAVMEAFSRDGVEPTTGTREFLRQHAQLGLEPVVVSSSAAERLAVSVEAGGIAEYFDTFRIFSAQDVEFMKEGGRRKPAPDVYLHALESCNLKPTDVVAIEDSKSGVLSAMRAGIDVIYFVGADISPSKDEVERMLTTFEQTLRETRPSEESWPAGKVIGVTDDNSQLSTMVSSLRSGSPYSPWMCHTGSECARDIDLDGVSFSRG